MSSHAWRGSARESSNLQGHRRRREAHASTLRSDVRLSLPARPENVAVIRHVLGAFAEALRLPASLVEDMRLAVTEACTNVVRHAYVDAEHGTMDVVIKPTGEHLELVVADHGHGMGPSPDVAGPGLGLPMIDALADEVRVEPGVTRGTRVVMSFRCRPRLGVA